MFKFKNITSIIFTFLNLEWIPFIANKIRFNFFFRENCLLDLQYKKGLQQKSLIISFDNFQIQFAIGCQKHTFQIKY